MQNLIRQIAKIFIATLLPFLLYACGGRQADDLQEYTSWLMDPENGIIKEKYINGYKISVRYLPPDLLAYQELKNEKPKNRKSAHDSLSRVYSKNLYFLLTIGPDEREKDGSDVTVRGIKSFAEFSERSRELDFRLADHLLLAVGGRKESPILTNMENTWGITKSRSITTVFPKTLDIQHSGPIDYTFHDNIFNTGIHHFVFSPDDLNNIPTMNF